MPIHDQGYRRYGGHKARTGTGWIVIARAGVRTFIAKRAFLGLLLFAWLPFVVGAVQFFLASSASSFPQASLLKPSADTFRQFLEQQQTFVFFVTVYAGAGLIANDRRANALQIYLSKPLTRAEYILGKLSILAAFLLLVTWVPAILLLLWQIALAGNFTFFMANAFLFPAITLFAFLQVVLASSTMLALSSLSKSSRYVAILYAGLIFFSSAVYNVLYAVTRNSSLSWLSFSASLEQMGDIIFRQKLHYDTAWPVSLLAILVLVGASALILERRVRGIEVVA